jgi:hypothetical protein
MFVVEIRSAGETGETLWNRPVKVFSGLIQYEGDDLAEHSGPKFRPKHGVIDTSNYAERYVQFASRRRGHTLLSPRNVHSLAHRALATWSAPSFGGMLKSLGA